MTSLAVFSSRFKASQAAAATENRGVLASAMAR
jgi:hypothetical protein